LGLIFHHKITIFFVAEKVVNLSKHIKTTKHMKTRDELIDELLTLAFSEDVGDGDHTTLSTIPADARGKQQLIVKEHGILAGVEIARKVFAKFDPELAMTVYIADGTEVKPGDVAFVVEGRVQSLLQTERIMLNIMQRMSGIATTTHRYQQELQGLKTKVIDTRKTMPGMRLLDKEAVKIGGGGNHRIGLFDMILIKDNHVDFAGGVPQAIRAAKNYCARTGRNLKIEVEVRNTAEIDQALAEGVDRIMLDNFTPERTAEAVRHINGATEIESSGGITLATLRQYGECGVDFISVGALTHSVKGLDMSFKAVK
jgi:nicotinate-nucleotide pyrophosphorylase (carboxylating)